MKALALFVALVLATQSAASSGNFIYNHLLETWVPKHDIFSPEVHDLKLDSAKAINRVHDGHESSPMPSNDAPTMTPRLIIYVQTFMTPEGKPLSLLPLLDHKTRVTHVILASVHLHDEPGVIKLNNNHFDAPLYDRIWNEVKILQATGVKVMAMMGGAAEGTWKLLNGTESEFYKYYNPLRDLIAKYNLDGLDIDIEQPLPLSTPIRLLTALHRSFGPFFILTMAPLSSALLSPTSQNLSGFSYFSLDYYASVPGSDTKLVHWYNAQFYGPFGRGPPTYEQVMEAGWKPERVVMGVLDCSDDGPPNGFVHLEMLGERIGGLRRQWEEFGGVSGWEYWDAGRTEFEPVESWEWVRAVGDALFDELPVVALEIEGQRNEDSIEL